MPLMPARRPWPGSGARGRQPAITARQTTRRSDRRDIEQRDQRQMLLDQAADRHAHGLHQDHADGRDQQARPGAAPVEAAREQGGQPDQRERRACSTARSSACGLRRSVRCGVLGSRMPADPGARARTVPSVSASARRAASRWPRGQGCSGRSAGSTSSELSGSSASSSCRLPRSMMNSGPSAALHQDALLGHHRHRQLPAGARRARRRPRASRRRDARGRRP